MVIVGNFTAWNAQSARIGVCANHAANKVQAPVSNCLTLTSLASWTFGLYKKSTAKQ
ncbi:uncharacterized protein DSM5745_02630 [Aspergillus mulundensis]|uniref:Uncharacterized protein n=1 Tax=Aspergillus mulundensis TaxID=1810919 RepID=A0A3D8SX08_9EURO|nr:hypothetical protein DSM5745_02630 [Aspergillus mulundensis]RDW90855.1 hypothetical protein DSM5745_02630 [Aspergillus mulundensis]